MHGIAALRLFGALLCVSAPVWFLNCTAIADEAFSRELFLTEGPASSWNGNTGDIFREGVSEMGLSFGPGLGMNILGSKVHQNWVLGRAEYGCMLSDVKARDRWYSGNWQIMADLFGGFQYHPHHAYVVGISPMLRYNFATGTRWVPFVSAGAGLTVTDIRNGEISTEFEFNLRIGPGVRYFFSEKWAATLHYQFIHLSNGGMEVPNAGINNSTLFLGVSRLF
jgi:lipid A 3-O-deacylase